MWSGTNIPVEVAIAKHFFKGIHVKFKLVSKGNESQLFLGSSQAQLGEMGPPDVALFNAEGNHVTILTADGSVNLINGVAIRAQDAGRYKSILDLKGKTLAIPGFGSSTYFAFSILMHKVHNIDPKKEFHIVVADPGAELGLLNTGKVDAALLFSGQTAAALGSPNDKLLLSMTDVFKKATGQSLVTDSVTAKEPWADQHPEAVKKLVQGIDRAVKWMVSHPEAFKKGAEFGDLAAQKGWTASPSANKSTLNLLASGKYYIPPNSYTKAWRDAYYTFIQNGKSVLMQGHNVPPESDIFYTAPE